MATNVFRVDREKSYGIYYKKNGRYYVTYWNLSKKLGIYEPSRTYRISKAEYEQVKEKSDGEI